MTYGEDRDTTELPDELEYQCPVCEQEPGEPCLDRDGKVMDDTHPGRVAEN